MSRAGHCGLPKGSSGRRPGEGAQGRSLPTPRSGPPRGPRAPARLAADLRSTRGEGVLKGAVRERTWKTPEKATQGLLPPPPCTLWTCDTGVPWGCARNIDTQAPQTPEGDAAVNEISRGLCSFRCGSEPPGSPRTQLTQTQRACPSSTVQPPLSVRGQEPGFGKPFISTAKSVPRTASTGGCPSPS